MAKLTIVGLGPGSSDYITIAALRAMKSHEAVYLRTEKHPAAAFLIKEGINYKTFDYAYESYDNFEEVYQHIVSTLINRVMKENVLYAVPGNPYVAEDTVQMIVEKCTREEIEKEVCPAVSFLDVMFAALGFDPVNGFKLIDGLQIDVQQPDINAANIITQIYDPFIASDIKLKLMDYYDHEQEVFVVKNAGMGELEKVKKIPLFELDRQEWIDYLTSVYIPKIDASQKKYYNMNNLVEIMEKLKSKEGCPWDKKQTHTSLKPCLIEECYEVLEAIDREDDLLLEEELGDLLLQVVFHSEIAKERGAFNINDVIRGLCKKLVFRHPHVFGEIKAGSSEEAIQTWEQQKRGEKQINSTYHSMLTIPKGLPALIRAHKIQKKAAQVGFDWDRINEVVQKIYEELEEILQAKDENNPEKIKSETGDLIFAAVNLARFLDIDSEEALNLTCNKFIARFRYIEEKAQMKGKNLKEMSLEEMDGLWEESKKTLKAF